MPTRSSGDTPDQELSDVLTLPPSAEWAIRVARTVTLETAMAMLQAQIMSRRQIASQPNLSVAEVDEVSRQIQCRVDRVRLVVAELRRRGLVVDWEE